MTRGGPQLSQGRHAEGVRPASNLAADVLLHPVGHVDQPSPRLLQERHHAIHVAVAGQRDFDLALALAQLRLGLFQLVRLRQRSSILPVTVGSRAASCAFSFSLSACSRPISASRAARSAGTAWGAPPLPLLVQVDPVRVRVSSLPPPSVPVDSAWRPFSVSGICSATAAPDPPAQRASAATAMEMENFEGDIIIGLLRLKTGKVCCPRSYTCER